MDNENIDIVEEEQVESTPVTNEDFKEAAGEVLKKVRTQALLLGSQAMCSTMLQKIKEFEHKPGKRTLNDHRRLVADIKNFCEIGLSRKVNLDGTTSIKEEDESND